MGDNLGCLCMLFRSRRVTNCSAPRIAAYVLPLGQGLAAVRLFAVVRQSFSRRYDTSLLSRPTLWVLFSLLCQPSTLRPTVDDFMYDVLAKS